MANSKQIFLSNSELSKWWAAIAHDHRFQLVLIHVRSEFLGNNRSAEQIMGAQAFENVLSNISDNEDASQFVAPKSPLDHNIDHPRSENTKKDANTKTGTTQPPVV